MPEVIEAAEMVEKKYESQAYIKNHITFDIKNNYNHKTVGFVLKLFFSK